MPRKLTIASGRNPCSRYHSRETGFRRFESFDRLADEDYRPRLWERFNPRKFREHIRTRRH